MAAGGCQGDGLIVVLTFKKIEGLSSLSVRFLGVHSGRLNLSAYLPFWLDINYILDYCALRSFPKILNLALSVCFKLC